MKTKSEFIFLMALSCVFIFLTSNCSNTVDEYSTPKITIPVLTTSALSEITTNYAKGGGHIISVGNGLVNERGICWSTSHMPTISKNKIVDRYGSEPDTYTCSISDLNQNQTYYVRAYAINEVGTGYGNEVSFKTNSASMPSLTLRDISYYYGITISTVKLEISISDDGGSYVTEFGACYSVDSMPTLSDSVYVGGTGIGTKEIKISNLIPNTTYYIRAYAKNEVGITYSNQQVFSTFNGVLGFDGFEYPAVTIGSQIWITMNLCEYKFQNGDFIPKVVVYTYLDEYQRKKYVSTNPFGLLYNWDAVNDSRKIAPKGWHVATYSDWQTLINYAGGASIAGGYLKSTNHDNWYMVYTNSRNSYGFSAVGSGFQDSNGNFLDWLHIAHFWSSTESGNSAYGVIIGYNSISVSIFLMPKDCKLPIRLVKD